MLTEAASLSNHINQTSQTADTAEISLSELIRNRREKLQQIQQTQQAFPNDFRRTHLAGDLQKIYQDLDKPLLEQKKIHVRVAGRIMLRRIMGKASFFTLQDMSGRIQMYARKNQLAAGVYEQFMHWDLGDIVGVEGILFRTHTGELTVEAKTLRLLTKSLRPLPEKHKGLQDKEICYRQRYLDLMVNSETRQVFQIRSQVVQHIRRFFSDKGFIEVETPMMQLIPGGANARPFVTHHNALNQDMYLRIAPELYLKRLIVGGMEQVFEINRNFRNEGLSTKHNPEFTMLEFYQAYADYHDLMALTEALLSDLVQSVKGAAEIRYQQKSINFSKPFTRLTLQEAIIEYNQELNTAMLQDQNALCAFARAHGINHGSDVAENWSRARIQLEIFEKTVEAQLQQPTFITEYPAEVSPLARKNDRNPEVTDRFELFIAGKEIANGFSELNDADDQAQRFRAQVVAKQAGDQEAMHYDADYIEALEYGMPPTAGEGIGIDRLVMLLTDAASIKDVILFPHMRPSVTKAR